MIMILDFVGSNIVLIPMGLLLGTYWFVSTQCVLGFLNIKGLRNCKKECKIYE